MLTPEQERRLEQRFRLFDHNNDGRVDRMDFEAEARRVLDAFGETTQSPKGKAVVSAYLRQWDDAARQMNVDPQQAHSLQQFKAAASKNIIEKGDKGFEQMLRPVIKAVMDLADTDGDGRVSPEEYKRLFKTIGVGGQDAATSFRTLDVNNNGYVEVNELVKAFREYYFGEPTPAAEAPLLGSA